MFHISSMTRVSKAWRVYIKDQPILWSDISFQGPKPAGPDVIRACIRNSQNRVRRLQLQNVKDPLNAAQQASRCPRLEHLDIDGALTEHQIFNLFHKKETLKTLILSERIPLCRHMLCNMLGLPNLERVEVRSFQIEPIRPKSEVGVLPNLKILALNMKRKALSRRPTYFNPFWVTKDIPDMATIEDLEPRRVDFDRVPNLQELRLIANDGEYPQTRLRVYFDDICHPNLRILALSNLALHGTWNCPETMEHLHLTECNVIYIPDKPAAPLMLPRLKSLILRGIDCSSFRLLEILENTTGSLEMLELIDCHHFTPANLLATNKDGLKNLKKLHLFGVDFYSLETPAMLSILELMPQLKELHIPHTRVTGTLIRKIVEGIVAPCIELLNLKGCLDVSIEAVEYGRANGLRIMRC